MPSEPARDDAMNKTWPWWALRSWHGMPLRVWLPLLVEHRWRVSPSHWRVLAAVTMFSGMSSMAEALCGFAYRRQLRAPPGPPPPLFIIGHWRSGTTLLHELMSLDQRFCSPNYYQCFSPGHFPLTERMLAPLMALLVMDKRPMDDMPMSFGKPQEDEFALMNMGAPSPYRRFAFPVTGSRHPEALDLTALPAAELEKWRQALRRFLGMLAVADARRPLLKSPAHTARVGVLQEMFPRARFLHIVRNPFEVFASTMRLWRMLDSTQGLQAIRDDESWREHYVFACFEEMYAAFERDRARLGPGQLHEMRYEDLVADPVGQLAQVYERMDLGDFSDMKLAVMKEMAARKHYRAATYRHDARTAAEIARRWKPFIDRYGYPLP